MTGSAQEPASPIGLIGIGRMGRAIGEHLLDLGESLVVWNRSPHKAKSLVARGAILAEKPRAVARQARTILVIVYDDAATAAIYREPGGLLEAGLAGRIVVNMATCSIGMTKSIGAEVAAQRGGFVDAPVSGTVAPARSGALIVMAGASATDLDAARPVLRKIARKIVHAGPVGSGTVLKLVLNLPLAAYWQTLGEALAIGRAHGLELSEMLELIADSKAAIGALASKLPTILGRSATVDFNLAGMHKDLRAMLGAAEACGVDTPALAAVVTAVARAEAAGWGGADVAALSRFAMSLETTQDVPRAHGEE
jgi:3-hydroxyisobutyrate dehydrogenase-like beta-hydroxyacid dehydrogenase